MNETTFFLVPTRSKNAIKLRQDPSDPSLRRDRDGETNTPPLRGGRLSFPLDYNDLRGMGLLVGLILRLDPS
jgi:hypothetical protein